MLFLHLFFILLDKHAVSKDSPAKFSLPGEYVTTGFWRPVLSSETKGEISAVVKTKVGFDLASPMAGLADYGRPSTPQILRYMKVDSRDYSDSSNLS